MGTQARKALGEIVLERRRAVGFVVARALRERITARIYLLREFPELGRRLDDSSANNRRELIVPPYRVIYTLRGETVIVLAIVHSRVSMDKRDSDT